MSKHADSTRAATTKARQSARRKARTIKYTSPPLDTRALERELAARVATRWLRGL